MIKLYVADIAVLEKEEACLNCYGMLDRTRQECVQSYKNEVDKKRSLLAGYLIQVGVMEYNSMKESGLHNNAAPLSLAYSYGENGKPYLADYPGLFFNLSHSGNFVATAFSSEEIGLDIQEHEGEKDGIAKRFFSAEDNSLLDRCKMGETGISKDDMFYRMWSVKEASMKLTGLGMADGMDKAYLEFMKWNEYTQGKIKEKAATKHPLAVSREIYFRLVDFAEGYSMAVCSYSKIDNLQRCEVKIDF